MATDLLGDRVDIGEEIGRGAMGVVHRAEMNGQTVAVKILHAHLHADLTAVGRFVREHQALSRISHPNVVRLVDLIIDDPRIGIVMEFLDATDLSKVLAAERLDPAAAVTMAADIAAGVAAIHEAGVVHRDLKPANILIVDGHHPKITDFGVSRLTGQSSSKATTTLGTPLYMSPEAADGSASIEAPADVYSLGVILFEMLTGQTPFNGDEPIAIAVAHVATPPPSVAGVPPALAELVDAMLVKDPGDRPTAAEVEQRLQVLTDDIGPDTDPVVIHRGGDGAASSAGSGGETVLDLTGAEARLSAASPAAATLASGPPSDETIVANRVAGNGPNPVLAPERTLASDTALAPPVPPPVRPAARQAAPDVASTTTVGRPIPTARSVLHEPTGRDQYEPPLVAPSPDKPDREFALSIDTRAFIALAVLATVITGVLAFAAFRSDGWLADDVGGLAAEDIAYSFAPQLSANGVITTRRWEYDPTTNQVEAEVGLTNTTDDAVSGRHYEVLPPVLADPAQGPVDFDLVAASFRPSPEEFSTDPPVATNGYSELASGQRLTITYRFPAPVGIGVQADLEQLAASQQKAEAAFLAALPSQEEEANAPEAVLESLDVEPAPIELAVGESIEVELSGVLSDGTLLDPQALESAVFTVDDTAVATVEGLTVRAVGSGRTVLEVTMGDVSARSTITVTRVSAGGSGGADDVAGSTTTEATTSTTEPPSSSTTMTTSSTQTSASTQTTATTSTTANTSTTESSTTTTEGEATLTMSGLSATVQADGSFRITFSTNLCTIANYQGAGQSYITPGWPDVGGTCWQNHGQNFTPVPPGDYSIVVKARSAGGQEVERSTVVTIG